MNRKLKVSAVISAGVIILIAVIFFGKKDYIKNQKENVVSNAQAAKSLALLLYTNEECRQFDGAFEGDEWYVVYMNVMYEEGVFKKRNIAPDKEGANGAFTYDTLENFVKEMKMENDKLKELIKKEKGDKNITAAKWSEIYEILVGETEESGVKLKKLQITATIKNTDMLDSWEVATDCGKYDFYGISLDCYIDKEINAFVKDREIVWVKEPTGDRESCNYAYVINDSGEEIQVFADGVIRGYKKAKKEIVAEQGEMVNLHLKNGLADGVSICENKVVGKVNMAKTNEIEIEGVGILKTDENVKICKTYGELEAKSIKDVVVGYDTSVFYLNEEGKIAAITINKDVLAKDIRVLIKTTNHASNFHDRVEICSDGDFILMYGENSEEIKKDTKVTFEAQSDYFNYGRVVLKQKNENAMFEISSIERGYGTPEYCGEIELEKAEGQIIIVNELPIEEYLKSVVPSEMPSSYSKEALKSQAVCARSYAYKQLLSNGLSEYGAHVDDSTSFQVYNNTQRNDVTNQAVNETYGEILKCGDEIVSAYFYSTSCGAGTDATIWGGANKPYIKGRIISDTNDTTDLTDEENFIGFIKNNYDSYDMGYGFYRWTLEVTKEDLEKTINEKIGMLYKQSPDKVKTLAEGKYVSKEIESVGKIKKIETGKRMTGGVLHELYIYGSEKTVKVETEYYIRQLIYPVTNPIIKADGTAVSSFGLLPSAFIIMEETDEGYKITGGGYGHGVGLSQNGANSMAKSGKTYTDILNFFYNNVKIEKIY